MSCYSVRFIDHLDDDLGIKRILVIPEAIELVLSV